MPQSSAVRRSVQTIGARLRPAIRDLAAEILWRARVTDPKRRGTDQLTIVTFHRVLTQAQLPGYPIPEIAVTVEEFEWFMEFFAEHFECGPLRSCLDRFHQDGPGDRPLLAVTFDDGQLDNYDNACPVLARHGVCATFFATALGAETGGALWHDEVAFAIQALLVHTPDDARKLLAEIGLTDFEPTQAPGQSAERLKRLDHAGRRAFIDRVQQALGGDGRPEWDGMMNGARLAELASGGHEVGSHTVSHAILVHCQDEELRREVEDSKQRLEKLVGAPVETFCYPNGDCDLRVVRAVQQAGYRAAVTTAWGRNGRSQDVMRLLRCDIQGATARTNGGGLSAARLGLRLSGLQPGL